jgi:hypothetical protein
MIIDGCDYCRRHAKNEAVKKEVMISFGYSRMDLSLSLELTRKAQWAV